MIDFLRANPWCSREEYTWGMTVAQIRLSSFDFTRVEYRKDKDKTKKSKKQLKNAKVISGGSDLLKGVNDLGLPIL